MGYKYAVTTEDTLVLFLSREVYVRITQVGNNTIDYEIYCKDVCSTDVVAWPVFGGQAPIRFDMVETVYCKKTNQFGIRFSFKTKYGHAVRFWTYNPYKDMFDLVNRQNWCYEEDVKSFVITDNGDMEVVQGD